MVASPATNMDPSNLILAELAPHAEAIAPHFSRAVIINLATSPIADRLPIREPELLKDELEHWFTTLFYPHNSGSQYISNNKTETQRSHSHLPLSFLLSNLEIILSFGHKVTSFSPQSELFSPAFVKSLSFELAKKQVDVEWRLEFVSNLFLEV
jgi:hypothetical protein